MKSFKYSLTNSATKTAPNILFSLFIIFIPICFILLSIVSQQNQLINFSKDFFKSGKDYPEFCEYTKHIEELRKRHGSATINPSHQVVEELVEILTVTPTVCKKKKDEKRLAVAIVHSAREHFLERQIIRETWGSLKKYKEWRVVVAFIMGQSDYCLKYLDGNGEDIDHYALEERKIMHEHKVYGDIVIGSFTDTYRNLTYKHLVGYRLIKLACTQADFIIKADDDVFVDIPGILDLRTEELEQKSVKQPSDYYCYYWYTRPARANNKWVATIQQWPEDKYPPFCLGCGYAVSMDWVKKIWDVRSLGGFFWVDDMFVTGKLRKVAEQHFNVTAVRKNFKKYTIDTNGRPGYVLKNCMKDNAKLGLFVYLVRSRDEFQMEMKCLWKRALRIANVSTVIVLKY